jgi:GNAT superfamily N-acetyltransferase
MMTIERAETPDIPEVLRLLNGAAAWLHERGVDQWPNQFTAEALAPHVALAEVWLVRDGGQAVGTMRISADADPDFWTPAEAAEAALYVGGLAIARTHTGLGALMLRWAADYAHEVGMRWLRLDCRRDNAALHRYYTDRGWTYLRTEAAPGRYSGALFQVPAAADTEARAALPPPSVSHGWFNPGTRVKVSGQGTGTVTAVESAPGAEHGVVALSADQGSLAFATRYRIRLDSGREVTAERGSTRAELARA